MNSPVLTGDPEGISRTPGSTLAEAATPVPVALVQSSRSLVPVLRVSAESANAQHPAAGPPPLRLSEPCKENNMSNPSEERYEDSQLYRIRHSAAHVMAQAVLEFYPGDQVHHRSADRERFLL